MIFTSASPKAQPNIAIDFTDHRHPKNHPNPHQHRYKENSTGGTKTRIKKGEEVPEWSYK